MPARPFIIRTMALLILPASLLFASYAESQQRFTMPLPELPIQRDGMGVIWDMHQMSSGSSSVSMSVENGVTKINATEDGVKTWIEDDPNQGITVKITRQYGPEQYDELAEDQPELFMHLQAFPEETEDAEVEVSVGVTRTYKAADAEELKERHPQAWELYEKYTTGGGNIRVLDDRFGPGLGGGIMLPPRMRMPEFRVIPDFGGGMRIEIAPEGVRVHDEDEDQQEDSDQQRQSSRSEDIDT